MDRLNGDDESLEPAAKAVLLNRLQKEGVKPAALMKALGVSNGMASMMLSGQRGIHLKYLPRIATLLNTTVSELFSESEQKPNAGVTVSSYAKGHPVLQDQPVGDVPHATFDPNSPRRRSSDKPPIRPPDPEDIDSVVRFLFEVGERSIDIAETIQAKRSPEATGRVAGKHDAAPREHQPRRHAKGAFLRAASAKRR